MGSSWFKTKDKSVESTPLTNLFERECPYYMSYGMSYDEYWNGDAYLVYFYRESYKLKMRNKDREMWKLGGYIYEVLCDVSPILHAFSKKGTKPLPYRDKPMSDENDNLKTEKEKEQEIANERLRFRVFMENWARATKKQFENKK